MAVVQTESLLLRILRSSIALRLFMDIGATSQEYDPFAHFPPSVGD